MRSVAGGTIGQICSCCAAVRLPYASGMRRRNNDPVPCAVGRHAERKNELRPRANCVIPCSFQKTAPKSDAVTFPPRHPEPGDDVPRARAAQRFGVFPLSARRARMGKRGADIRAAHRACTDIAPLACTVVISGQARYPAVAISNIGACDLLDAP